MIGLVGTRVLVVDDNVEEALPVLNAFARRGIPTTFFDGKLSKLPRKRDRLIGVRLAVLDMDLGEGGGNKSVASALVKRIERILAPNNGPYVVLIWTNHPELRNLVERYIFQSEETPKPIFTTMITKADCKRGGRIVLDLVAKRLYEEMGNIGPLGFVQAWEGSCFQAATAVTHTLSNIAGETPTNLDAWRQQWRIQTLRVLRALARAKAEKQLDENNCLESICSLLNPLHADRMENGMPGLRKLAENSTGAIMDVEGECNQNRKAEVNTMLHLAFKELKGFAPGNMHIYRNKTNLGWPITFRKFLSSFVQDDNNPEQVRQWTKEVSRASYPVIIEISAVCDFAQKNLLAGRFLCGLLTLVTARKRVKKASYIKKIGPVILESNHVRRDQYNLYFSSRQVLSLSLGRVKRLRSDARLRGQALSDLQSWFSYQAGRQGITLLG